MSTIKANQLKKDMYVLFKDQPHAVIKCEFYFPGKGSAFARTRLRNARTGSVQEFTFKSNDEVELVEVEKIELQYLYADGSIYHFMNPRDYEQYEIPEKVFDGKEKFLIPEMKMFFTFYESEVIGVIFPPKVRLKVVEAGEAVAGNTVNAAKKPVTLETGVEIQAPLFVKQGETLIVDTEYGTYVSRAT